VRKGLGKVSVWKVSIVTRQTRPAGELTVERNKKKGRNLLNFIIIISDTFRRDHLGCYGNNWISTPHIDRKEDADGREINRQERGHHRSPRV